MGDDRKGMPVSIPVGYRSGAHTLVLGTTGSGKTVSETWIAGMIRTTHRLCALQYGAIERGEFNVRFDTIAKVAAGLGMTVAALCEKAKV